MKPSKRTITITAIATIAVWAFAIIQLQGFADSPKGISKYYTYTASNVVTHNLGYAPLDYVATDGNGFLTTSEANARKLPMEQPGVIKEFLVNVQNNSFNGPTVVKVHINGGEVSTCGKAANCNDHDKQSLKIVIPTGEKGIFDFGSVNIGYRVGDQITFVLDSQGSNAGSLSFVARIGVSEYPPELNFLVS